MILGEWRIMPENYWKKSVHNKTDFFSFTYDLTTPIKRDSFSFLKSFSYLFIVLFITSCGTQSGINKATRADWSSELGSHSRDGRSEVEVLIPPLNLTSYHISSYSNSTRKNPVNEKSSPVIYDNILYASSVFGKVSAIDLVSGDVLWSYKIKTNIEAGIGVSDEIVVIGDLDGTVYGIDRNSGELKWQTALKSTILSSPLIDDTSLYIQTSDNKVYSLSTADGSSNWIYGRIDLGSVYRRYKTSIAMGDGKLFTMTSDGYLVAIDKKSGGEKWRIKVLNDALYADMLRTTPVFANDKVYALNDNGNLSAYNKDTGKEVETYTFIKGKDFLVTENSIIFSAEGYLKAFSPSGLPLWSREYKKNSKPHTIIATDNTLFSIYNMKSWGSTKSNIEALDLKSGTLLWKKRFSEPAYTALALSDSFAAFTANDGRVYVIQTNYPASREDR